MILTKKDLTILDKFKFNVQPGEKPPGTVVK